MLCKCIRSRFFIESGRIHPGHYCAPKSAGLAVFGDVRYAPSPPAIVAAAAAFDLCAAAVAAIAGEANEAGAAEGGGAGIFGTLGVGGDNNEEMKDMPP